MGVTSLNLFYVFSAYRFLPFLSLSLSRTHVIYDKDSSIRQNAGKFIGNNHLSLPILAGILRQKNIDPEIRYDAFKIISMYDESQDIVELLEIALKDTNISIRINAAYYLEKVGKINSKYAVTIFIEGLKSENALTKMDAIFALNQMCFKNGGDKKRCADAKLALPMLIDIMYTDIKILQYSAALAIAYIEPKEERGVNILKEVLLEKNYWKLHDNVADALMNIGSLNSLSSMIQSLVFQDKQSLYASTCLYQSYLPRKNQATMIRAKLLQNALKNENVRLSASNDFHSLFDNKPSLSEVQYIVSNLTSTIKNKNIQYSEYPILQKVFKLKDQDIRRSAIYALGSINFSQFKKVHIYYQFQKEITDVLTAIVIDQNEDLDIRWMAAAKLQSFKIPMDNFFEKQKLVNPATAIAKSRWIGLSELRKISDRKASFLISRYENQYVNPETTKTNLQNEYLLNQYGYIPALHPFVGLDFDIYSKQYIYNSAGGCGGGLGEIFNVLRSLLNGSKK
jgi:HEAT repeat protein